MTILASKIGGSFPLYADQYRCIRCGHTAKFNLTRGRPLHCNDCLEVLRWEVLELCEY